MVRKGWRTSLLASRRDRAVLAVGAGFVAAVIGLFVATHGGSDIRLVAAALGRPAVVRIEVTLGDPGVPEVHLRPGEVLAIYSRSAKTIGGFWLPPQGQADGVLLAGVDYPDPFPSSAGYRERFDAFTASKSGHTTLALAYVPNGGAPIPAMVPLDVNGNPLMVVSVLVSGAPLNSPSTVALDCSGSSCSAGGFEVSVTNVVPHQAASSPCGAVTSAESSAPSCGDKQTVVTLSFRNRSTFDWSTRLSEFSSLSRASGPAVGLGFCGYVPGQLDLAPDGTLLIPPGATVRHYVFCLREPAEGLQPFLRWSPPNASSPGDLRF